MGAYYSKKIEGYLIESEFWLRIRLLDEGKTDDGAWILPAADFNRAAAIHAAECIEGLLVEQLRYQGWETRVTPSISGNH